METIGKLRRRHLVKGESISAIARDLNLSRNTVKKYLKAAADPVYQRESQPAPKRGEFQATLATWLEQDSQDAFVPLVFRAGDACQFDWSHEQVILGGMPQVVKVAHFRLSHSRQMFLAAYPRESREMVFDAHNRAFAFFGGVPNRMIYDTCSNR